MLTRRAFVASLVATVVAVAAMLPGCGGGGDSGKPATSTGGSGSTETGPIKIGSLQSMTGLNSTFGQSTDKGIRLAMEEKNKAGGIMGRQIEIITADTESSPDKTPLAVLKLIEQDKVVAVLGEVASSRSIAAAPICQKNKIPMLSPSSTNPKVTMQGSYIFRSCFIDDFQGVIIAKYTIEDLKLKRAAIMTDTKNDYSTGLTKILKEDFVKRGGTIVAEETYQAGDASFKTQLNNIKGKNPDIVFLPGYYTEVPQVHKDARELGLNCPFIGGDGWDSDVTLKDGGKYVEGSYFTNHYDAADPDPRAQEFAKKYKEHFNGEIPDAMSVTGYDAANIMFAAIENAKSTDGAAVRDALAKTKDFPAVTGAITIGPDRNAVKPAVVMKIEGGKFVLQKRVNP
jgi:branched-chain amino acid transport system substrate-binding protein